MLNKLNMDGWEANTSWCVPSAIAMITGASVGFMHSRAAFLLNEKLLDVKGIYWGETVMLFREQGYKCTFIDLVDRYGENSRATVGRFLKERSVYEKIMPIIFSTDDHMMCAHMNYAGDNKTKGPVRIENFHSLKKYITHAAIVSPFNS